MKKLKVEIKWAILFSIMTLVWMVLEKLSGLHSNYIDYHLYLTNLFAIPAIWFMVMALQEKKKVYYGGQMSYKQGLISGLILSVIIALLSPLTQWIISYVISPEYFPNVIKRSVEIGYFKSTAEAEANFNYSNYAKQGAIGALIMGIVTTAIAMIFIRSKKLQ
jgi:hypothetical protein